VNVSFNYYGFCPSWYNVYYSYDNYNGSYYSDSYCHSWYYASYYRPEWCWPSTRWRRYRCGEPWWDGCSVIGGVYVWTNALYPWDELDYGSVAAYPGYWDAEREGEAYYTVTGPSYNCDGRYVRVLERNHVRGSRRDTALVNRGVTLAHLGRWDRAMAQWERALDENPDNASAHYDLGVAQEIRGNHYEAIHHYYEAASLRPASRRYQTALQDLEDRFPNVAELVRDDYDEGYGFLKSLPEKLGLTLG